MKNILHTALILACFLSVTLSSSAQYRHTNHTPSLAIGLQMAEPRGEFAEKFDGYPVGIGGTFTAPINHSPFELGFGYAWNSMGSKNKDITAVLSTDSTGNEVTEPGTMRIRNSINRYQVIARFRPFAGAIQPYAEAFAGVDAYKTKTDITLSNSGYSESTNAQRQHLDLTYSFGWAAGLRVRLRPNVFVEGRFENVTGGPAEYVDDESIAIDQNDQLVFSTKKSNTNKYVYQVGMAFTF